MMTSSHRQRQPLLPQLQYGQTWAVCHTDKAAGGMGRLLSTPTLLLMLQQRCAALCGQSCCSPDTTCKHSLHRMAPTATRPCWPDLCLHVGNCARRDSVCLLLCQLHALHLVGHSCCRCSLLCCWCCLLLAAECCVENSAPKSDAPPGKLQHSTRTGTTNGIWQVRQPSSGRLGSNGSLGKHSLCSPVSCGETAW